MAGIAGLEEAIAEILRSAQEMVDQGRIDERRRDEFIRRHLTNLLGRTTNILQHRLVQMLQMGGDAGSPHLTYQLVRDILENGAENHDSTVVTGGNKSRRRRGVRSRCSGLEDHLPDDIRREIEEAVGCQMFVERRHTPEDADAGDRRDCPVTPVHIPPYNDDADEAGKEEAAEPEDLSWNRDVTPPVESVLTRPVPDRRSLKKRIQSLLGRLIPCKSKKAVNVVISD